MISMKYSIIPSGAVALFLSVAALAVLSHAATLQSAAVSNLGVVVLETEGSTGISVRIAEELARATNDTAGRRILPVVGVGSLQNIMDLGGLHNIDLAILQT